MYSRAVDLFLEVPEVAIDFYNYCRINGTICTLKTQTSRRAPHDGGFEIVVNVLDAVIYCRTIKKIVTSCRDNSTNKCRDNSTNNCEDLSDGKCNICGIATVICEYWLRDIPFGINRYQIRDFCSFGYRCKSNDEKIVISENIMVDKGFYQIACKEVDKYINL